MSGSNHLSRVLKVCLCASMFSFLGSIPFGYTQDSLSEWQERIKLDLQFARPGSFSTRYGGGRYESNLSDLETLSAHLFQCGDRLSLFMAIDIDSEEVDHGYTTQLTLTAQTQSSPLSGVGFKFVGLPQEVDPLGQIQDDGSSSFELPVYFPENRSLFQGADQHILSGVIENVPSGRRKILRQDLQILCAGYSSPRGSLQVHLSAQLLSRDRRPLSSALDLISPSPLSLTNVENLTGINRGLAHLELRGTSVDQPCFYEQDSRSNVLEEDTTVFEEPSTALPQTPALFTSDQSQVKWCYAFYNYGTLPLTELLFFHEDQRLDPSTPSLVANPAWERWLEYSSVPPGGIGYWSLVQDRGLSRWVHGHVETVKNSTRLTQSRLFLSAVDEITLDSDGDGLSDQEELYWGSHPLRSDSDEDGLTDGEEVFLYELDPQDADCDDDGVIDGAEWPIEATTIELKLDLFDVDADGLVNALDSDSDNDGILDGVETGQTRPHPDTDLRKGAFQADADPQTQSNPFESDSDFGGCPDGIEDLNHNGALEGFETNPMDPNGMDDLDQDGDGWCDSLENQRGTSVDDADSDDDGVIDSLEPRWNEDSDGDGLINVFDPDSDNDGLFDGTEMGIVTPSEFTNEESGFFQADLDPSTTTDPLNADSDGGGILDGIEDFNHNGRVDEYESNPLSPLDDAPDRDQDGVSDQMDNCPQSFNPEQGNLDGDKWGNVCDLDRDGDGVANDFAPAVDQGCQTERGSNPVSSALWILCLFLSILYRKKSRLLKYTPLSPFFLSWFTLFFLFSSRERD